MAPAMKHVIYLFLWILNDTNTMVVSEYYWAIPTKGQPKGEKIIMRLQAPN